jgi:hypothetical protein
MNRFEAKIREALKPEEPPLGFAERVMARTQDRHIGSQKHNSAYPRLRWAAAVVLCALLFIGGMEYYRQRTERSQSAAAKQQLMLALQIAGKQLRSVQSKINRP